MHQTTFSLAFPEDHSAGLKQFGFDTAFVEVVREALDVTYEIPDWDPNPFNPNDIPF